jgi:hypothetical protein
MVVDKGTRGNLPAKQEAGATASFINIDMTCVRADDDIERVNAL